MSPWEDGQPNGPEPEPWQTSKSERPQPHGYFEPSKWSLLSGTTKAEREHWHRLLADNVASHDLWWARLMRFLKRSHGR